MDELQVRHPVVTEPAVEASSREAAFGRFLDVHLADHYRLAAVILGDPVEAQDATHDALELAWRGWDRLRDTDRFDAWASRILVNVCRDRLRRRRRRPVTDISAQVSESLAAPDHLGVTVDRDEIGRAFATLNADQQIALALRFYGDLTVEQIAERVGAPTGTVKSRLHHALRLLNAELSRSALGTHR